MSTTLPERIVDRDGESREVLDVVEDGRSLLAVVRASRGGRLHVPLDDLDGEGGTRRLPAAWPDLESNGRVIPVPREELSVDKRVVERERVRIHKRVREDREVVDAPLLHEEAVVERVRVDRLIDEVPDVRHDGDTLVVPVVEEVLVVGKRLLLREEVRVRIARSQRRARREVPVRREEVEVERRPPDDED